MEAVFDQDEQKMEQAVLVFIEQTRALASYNVIVVSEKDFQILDVIRDHHVGTFEVKYAL